MTIAFSSRSMNISCSAGVIIALVMSMSLWSSFSTSLSRVSISSSCRNLAIDTASARPEYIDWNMSSSVRSFISGRNAPMQYSAIVSKFMARIIAYYPIVIKKGGVK